MEEGKGGLNREGGLINFPPLKRGGGLIREGGLFERGWLNRGLAYLQKNIKMEFTESQFNSP